MYIISCSVILQFWFSPSSVIFWFYFSSSSNLVLAQFYFSYCLAGCYQSVISPAKSIQHQIFIENTIPQHIRNDLRCSRAHLQNIISTNWNKKLHQSHKRLQKQQGLNKQPKVFTQGNKIRLTEPIGSVFSTATL